MRPPIALILAILPLLSARAQDAATAWEPPDDISYRRATILSEGTRMAAEVFAPADPMPEKLPTIVMCHGWGGVARALRPDALAFARAGYLVATFDYRGWGESDPRVVLTGPAPEVGGDSKFKAEVQAVREVVDPIDQTTDLMNAIHWTVAEPRCDPDRLGLWGSSYSGGHVVYVAARDPRVKAIVSQVPSLDSRWTIATPAARKPTFAQATARARGEIGYPEPGAKVVGNLKGAPILEKMIGYAPVEDVGRAPECAMLFLIAEDEELFDNKDHAILALERAKGPKKLVTIPEITHYGIYGQAREQARRLAIGWFDEHLKP